MRSLVYGARLTLCKLRANRAQTAPLAALSMPQRAIMFLVLLTYLGHEVHAARPFVTDDARIVDKGGCQIETFIKRQRKLDEREFWFLPACNPFGRVELTLGRTWVDSMPGDSRVDILQAKTLIKALETNGSGYALTLGAGRVLPFQAPRTVNPYLNAIGSFSFADEGLL